ncbi:unnamed protein product [Amoebophrya sp. A25]|nr:unnamed protein product [Amoebophrya sp. A25]|eukprot:GSA25T00024113001.1
MTAAGEEGSLIGAHELAFMRDRGLPTNPRALAEDLDTFRASSETINRSDPMVHLEGQHRHAAPDEDITTAKGSRTQSTTRGTGYVDSPDRTEIIERVLSKPIELERYLNGQKPALLEQEALEESPRLPSKRRQMDAEAFYLNGRVALAAAVTPGMLADDRTYTSKFRERRDGAHHLTRARDREADSFLEYIDEFTRRADELILSNRSVSRSSTS